MELDTILQVMQAQTELQAAILGTLFVIATMGGVLIGFFLRR